MESIIQTGQPERVTNLVVSPARCNTRRQREAIQRINNTVDRTKLSGKSAPI